MKKYFEAVIRDFRIEVPPSPSQFGQQTDLTFLGLGENRFLYYQGAVKV